MDLKTNLKVDAGGISQSALQSYSRNCGKHLGGVGKKNKKLSPETLGLINNRRYMLCKTVRDKKEIDFINKEKNLSIRNDVKKFNTSIITNTIKIYKGPKVLSRKTSTSTKKIVKLKNNTGNIVTKRTQLLSIVEKF